MNAVGCYWVTVVEPDPNDGFLPVAALTCAATLLKFNIPSLAVTVGASYTLKSAVLKMTPVDYAGDTLPIPTYLEYANEAIAIASNWSGSTITWNTVMGPSFSVYVNPGDTASMQDISNPENTQTYDVKHIVKNWSNGTWTNNGLLIWPGDIMAQIDPDNHSGEDLYSDFLLQALSFTDYSSEPTHPNQLTYFQCREASSGCTTSLAPYIEMVIE